MQTLTDTELVRRAQEGDRDAFSVLAHRWSGTIEAFLRRLNGDAEEARDLCQETLLRAWTKISRLRNPEGLRSWLHSIALNLSRDRGRVKTLGKVRLVAWPRDEGFDPVSPAADPHTRAARRDLASSVQAALLELPQSQREAIVLREYEGFTSVEIAKLTGVPAATVRSRIFYGLRSLKTILQGRGITTAPDADGRQ